MARIAKPSFLDSWLRKTTLTKIPKQTIPVPIETHEQKVLPIKKAEAKQTQEAELKIPITMNHQKQEKQPVANQMTDDNKGKNEKQDTEMEHGHGKRKRKRDDNEDDSDSNDEQEEEEEENEKSGEEEDSDENDEDDEQEEKREERGENDEDQKEEIVYETDEDEFAMSCDEKEEEEGEDEKSRNKKKEEDEEQVEEQDEKRIQELKTLKNKYTLMRNKKTRKRFYKIELNGKKKGYCRIDVQDYELVKKYTWSQNRPGYAKATWADKATGIQYNILMHRLIKGLEANDEREVDHTDHDKSDNRRGNLEAVSKKQNKQNQPRQGGKLMRGVYLNPGKRFDAQVWDGKTIPLGTFDTEREAAEQRDLYNVKHERNAPLNFPELREEYKIRTLKMPKKRSFKARRKKIKTVFTPDEKNDKISCFKITSKGQEYEIKIDREDEELVKYSTWTLTSQGYPRSHDKGALHRFLKNAKPGQLVDHEDGNTKNCKKSNLRFSDAKANSSNISKRKNTTSRYFNVSLNGKGYCVTLTVKQQTAIQTHFPTEKEAAATVDLFSLNTFGQELKRKRNFIWSIDDLQKYKPLVSHWIDYYKLKLGYWSQGKGQDIPKQKPRTLTRTQKQLHAEFMKFIEMLELSEDCKRSHASASSS